MAKHTPGPWNAAMRQGDWWYSVVYIPAKWGYEICQCFHGRGKEEECTANTLLIAAAPDLLEGALNAREAILNERNGLAESGLTNDQVNAVLGVFDDFLSEAIAKAEGKP